MDAPGDISDLSRVNDFTALNDTSAILEFWGSGIQKMIPGARRKRNWCVGRLTGPVPGGSLTLNWGRPPLLPAASPSIPIQSLRCHVVPACC